MKVIHPDTFRTLKRTEQWFPDLVCNSDGDTALHLSARYHRQEITHYLLTEAKCDPNIKNQRGETLLQLLMSVKSWTDSECISVIEVLLSTELWDKNSSCNSKRDTVTALHLSAEYHRYEVTYYLLTDVKCDPNIKNQGVETPIQVLFLMESWLDSECVNIINVLISTEQCMGS